MKPLRPELEKPVSRAVFAALIDRVSDHFRVPGHLEGTEKGEYLKLGVRLFIAGLNDALKSLPDEDFNPNPPQTPFDDKNAANRSVAGAATLLARLDPFKTTDPLEIPPLDGRGLE